METLQAGDRVARIETLLEELAELADPIAREKATETVQALLDFYGEGLSRLVDYVAERDDGSLAEAVAGDEVVAHVLLLHGLHPVPVEDRVRAALEEVAPYLGSHGGAVQLVGVQDGIARLRLEGSCSGCPSSARTLKLAVEDAVMKAAPDLEGIEAEGVAPAASPAPALLQIEVVTPGGTADGGSASNGGGDTAWSLVGSVGELTGDGPRMREVRGEPVLFLRVGGEDYAYRPRCPACRATIGEHDLSGGELACPGCGNRFDARRAGLGLDAPDLQLEPVPLLVDDGGRVTVALGRRA
jgi:Fe-S cluster biogenesis protein NfuA/nitrite reductase/ring-hydroxylating ferredoxin subunit